MYIYIYMMNATNVKKINRTNNIVNSFNRIKRFFIKNYIYIISLVLLFIGVTVLFRMHGVNFNPNTSSHIDKIVTIESFSGGGEFINSVNEDATVSKKDKEDGEEPGDAEPGDAETGDAETGDAEPGDAEPGDAETGDAETEESNRKDDKEREETIRRGNNKSRHARFNRIGRDLGGNISSKGLCKKKKHEIHNTCKTLSEDRCKTTECCIYAHHKNAGEADEYKCIHGDESGPNYKTEDEKPIDIDHWYYMSKCYGPNCNEKTDKE